MSCFTTSKINSPFRKTKRATNLWGISVLFLPPAFPTPFLSSSLPTSKTFFAAFLFYVLFYNLGKQWPPLNEKRRANNLGRPHLFFAVLLPQHIRGATEGKGKQFGVTLFLFALHLPHPIPFLLLFLRLMSSFTTWKNKSPS